MSTDTIAYRHTSDMGEISGFGGGYEECCQDMLEAGVRWLNEHPEADLRLRDSKNIIGFYEEDTEDAKTLSEVILDASKREATGAMMHTVIRRLMWIKFHGWDAYCAGLREREAAERRGEARP